MKEGSERRVQEPAAERAWRRLALAYAAGLGAMILYANRAFYHDDAYITLRYARNLIDGLGPVWNPGERVQGYTNFLHLMLVSLLGRLGIDLVWASRIIGGGSLIGLVSVLLVLGASVDTKREGSLWHVPAILVMTSAPLLVWSLGGLEGPLFSFLVAAGCLFFVKASELEGGSRAYAASGACLGLSFLARPDGVVFIAISAFWLLVMRQNRPGTLRSVVPFAASIAIVTLPYLAWQVFYYGDLVPNTFYAKTGSLSWARLSSGFRYVVDYATRPPYLPLLTVGALVYAAVTRHWSAKLSYLALSVAGYAAFVIFVGGDHMQAFRLLLPLVALMSVVFALALSPAVESLGRLGVFANTLAVLALASLQLSDEVVNPRVEDPAALVGTIVGKHIADAWPEGSVVALNTAGSTPYFAGQHRYIDMLGLNDAHIAKRHIEKIQLPWQRVPGHLKGDGDYVLSRKPDFIIVGPAEGTVASNPWFLSDLEMANDPRFEQDYALFRTRLDANGAEAESDGLVFTYYQRIPRP